MKFFWLVGEHQIDIRVRPFATISASSVRKAKALLMRKFSLKQEGKILVDGCGNRYRLIETPKPVSLPTDLVRRSKRSQALF